MKSVWTKSVLLLLLVAMTLCAFAACGGDKPGETTEAQTEAATQPQTEEATEEVTEAPTEEATEEAVTDEETAEETEEATEEETEEATEEITSEEETEEETEEPEEIIAVPEVDYSGKEFQLLMRNHDYFCNDLVVETINADTTSIVDRAVFARLKAIEEETGIDVVLSRSSSGNDDTDQLNPILTGDDTYDLIANHGRSMYYYAGASTLMNWYDVPFLSDCLAYEWWNQGMLEDFTVNGKVWVMSGDMSYQNLGATVALVMNKEVCRKIGFDYPNEELVPDGTWTHEVFTEMVMAAKGDLDGDGEYTMENDMIGYATTLFRGPLCILYTGGGSLVRNTGSSIEVTVNEYPIPDIYDWFFGLFEEEHILGHFVNYDFGTDMRNFAHGQTLFVDNRLYDMSIINEAGMTDYAVVPYPKWDESVDKYYTWCDAVGNCFGIPITLRSDGERLERNAVIMELFARKGNESIIPAFYQRILLARYAQDKSGYAAMDLIKDGRRYDLACYMGGKNGLGSLTNCGPVLASQDQYGRSFATWYASIADKAEEEARNVNNLFADLEFGF